MVEIAEYEKLGDLDAPLELTRKAKRAQAEAERIRDALSCDVAALTWEEYVAGEPCPGCGRPYRDDEHWESKGTMYFTDEERARHEAEDARYRQDHAECGSACHSVSGSLTTHCGSAALPRPSHRSSATPSASFSATRRLRSS